MVNRIVVGAHYGLRDWIMQRVTAVIMLLYTAVLLCFLASVPHTHDAWVALFKQGWVRFFTFITFMSLALHVWVGMRDVLMDYIKPTGLRLTLLVVVILALVTYAAWSIQILWSI